MDVALIPKSFLLNPTKSTKNYHHIASNSFNHFLKPQTSKTLISLSQQTKPKTLVDFAENEKKIIEKSTMSDILKSSKAQNLELQLQTAGPFFRVTTKSSETNKVLGKEEG
ncbi:unnamed protein product [Lactuca virosa]|uniref:Uncharacterized protein n=1 Tax=Lactuca virosa TaxID=75947 RepID=A0AAU9MN46_9ASTR|nr:unnamed protein product [Lactuca virosa]